MALSKLIDLVSLGEYLVPHIINPNAFARAVGESSRFPKEAGALWQGFVDLGILDTAPRGNYRVVCPMALSYCPGPILSGRELYFVGRDDADVFVKAQRGTRVAEPAISDLYSPPEQLSPEAWRIMRKKRHPEYAQLMVQREIIKKSRRGFRVYLLGKGKTLLNPFPGNAGYNFTTEAHARIFEEGMQHLLNYLSRYIELSEKLSVESK